MPQQSLQRFKAEFFKALAHPTRITILELLREREQTVGELQERLAIDPSTVSQQLAVLRSRDIVNGRRAGSNVIYSVRDPEVFRLLDVARAIFDHHLIDMQRMVALAGEAAQLGETGSVAYPPAHVPVGEWGAGDHD